jgi:hypothetical protein
MPGTSNLIGHKAIPLAQTCLDCIAFLPARLCRVRKQNVPGGRQASFRLKSYLIIFLCPAGYLPQY